MHLNQNYSLKKLNSFGIDVYSSFYSSFKNLIELTELIEYSKNNNLKTLIIGGGTNILFTKDFKGLVLKNELMEIDFIKEDEYFFYIKSSAGVVWHDLVLYCINNNYAGLENLSLIPGCVGAAPMQNIGAYGVELKDVFFELEALHIETQSIQKFALKDCEFGYRESVFKHKLKDQFIILNITLRFKKNISLNTSYGAIEQELLNMNCKDISIKNISQAVINIRTSKLPNPSVIGNAGSFFKNPIVDELIISNLKNNFTTIPIYPILNNKYKIAAGWLIEQCGWKGFRKNDAGCHNKQALVLVNYGNASGKEIFDLSTEITESVFTKFGIELEREVNII